MPLLFVIEETSFDNSDSNDSGFTVAICLLISYIFGCLDGW